MGWFEEQRIAVYVGGWVFCKCQCQCQVPVYSCRWEEAKNE